jgi:adenylate cyclase
MARRRHCLREHSLRASIMTPVITCPRFRNCRLASGRGLGYFLDDERRPSVASVTTASSTGSKSSVVRPNVHKSLKNFFGDDFQGKDASDTSLPGHVNGKEHRSNSWTRHRNHSTSTETAPREGSPAPSRPRTPVPSSDVVPFLYQDSQVSAFFS